MSRYIDAEPIVRFLRGARSALPVESKDFHTRDEMLLNFEQYVNLAPTADVAEVKHGYWKRLDETQALFGVEWSCSECGQDIRVDGILTAIGAGWIYCPRCGAKMDGGQDK